MRAIETQHLVQQGGRDLETDGYSLGEVELVRQLNIMAMLVEAIGFMMRAEVARGLTMTPSAAMSAEMANHVCGMVFDRFDDRTFDPSEFMDVKRPGDVKTTALNRPALLAAMAHYPPAPITPLARY